MLNARDTMEHVILSVEVKSLRMRHAKLEEDLKGIIAVWGSDSSEAQAIKVELEMVSKMMINPLAMRLVMLHEKDCDNPF